MTVEEIKAAVDAGKKVFYKNETYEVVQNKEDYDIWCKSNDYRVGLTWMDGVTLNGNEKDFRLETGPRKVVLVYQYRDGNNKKTLQEVSFRVDSIISDERLFLADMAGHFGIGTRSFIASQVHLPEFFVWTGNPEIDHCFHEIVGIKFEEHNYPVDTRDERSIEDFVTIFSEEKNKGWKSFYPNRKVDSITPAGLFDEAKRMAKENRILNVSVSSLRFFGDYDFWSVASKWDPDIIEDMGDSIHFNVNTHRFKDEEVAELFMKHMGEERADSAKDIVQYIVKCANNGVDIVEVCI